MVDYLFDWLHNVLVTLATTSGIGLLTYVAMREFYPATVYTLQQSLRTAATWISGINLWPVVAVVVAVAVLSFTVPARRDHV